MQARAQGCRVLLTFGGAYSNHIAAVAAAGKEYGFETIGIIRGEELAQTTALNPTLSFAQSCGMKLDFVHRSRYRQKHTQDFLTDLQAQWGSFYFIPEGGTNDLAIQGCEEILTPQDAVYDYICCAVGTGGTISGIIRSADPQQKILGFPALKGDFLQTEIRKFVTADNWVLISDYVGRGYAQIDADLVHFINRFYQKTQVPLDPIYTGKMVLGVMDLIAKGFFPDHARILLIHTGGLQAVEGMNQVLQQKKLPLIIPHDEASTVGFLGFDADGMSHPTNRGTHH